MSTNCNGCTVCCMRIACMDVYLCLCVCVCEYEHEASKRTSQDGLHKTRQHMGIHDIRVYTHPCACSALLLGGVPAARYRRTSILQARIIVHLNLLHSNPPQYHLIHQHQHLLIRVVLIRERFHYSCYSRRHQNRCGRGPVK